MRVLLAVGVVFCTLQTPVSARAAVAERDVTRTEAAAVCERWLGLMVARHGDWAGDPEPVLRAVAPLDRDGVRLGWLCEVAPAGYIVVPSRRELSPVKAASEHGSPDTAATGGLAALVLDDLADRVARLSCAHGDPVPLHPAWPRWLGAEPPDKSAYEEAGPLLSTRWSQGWPYNTACPLGDGGQTFVGCTALAAAQLMRYHAWPSRGRGEGAYWWPGDDGCGGTSPGDTLRAAYADPYDWQLMDEVVAGDASQESRDAVAELCYETAVACWMDFSVCGSAASLARARAALVTQFRYGTAASERQRFRLSDATWFALICSNVDRGLPLLYSSTIHTMVCDGWREVDGLRQVHINYGWAGDSDGWYALDGILTSLNPSAERMVCEVQPDLTTPLFLADFVAARRLDGACLSWRIAAAAEVFGLHVWREDPDGGRIRLTAHPLSVEPAMQWTDPTPPPGATHYWLEELIAPTGTAWHGPARLSEAPPTSRCVVSAPHPNPCNPATSFDLTLDIPRHVRATVHDERGRRIRVLADGPQPAGRVVLTWDGTTTSGRTAASGVYLLRVVAGTEVQTRKVIVAR